MTFLLDMLTNPNLDKVSNSYDLATITAVLSMYLVAGQYPEYMSR